MLTWMEKVTDIRKAKPMMKPATTVDSMEIGPAGRGQAAAARVTACQTECSRPGRPVDPI
jgi:hypothetical protein